VEAYPDLKADRSFRQLSASLIEIEDNIQYARRYYNGTVRDYNIMVQSFPGLIVAQLFGFPLEEFFEIETATERQAPEVKL
jgi:LemA protein